ncbi:Histone-lysine N-methyltransferase EHMT1 [Lasiodiplodia theobromae]|uniref:Histone-lysine N-methyltransferase EHMT1 n=1 Tax=Lasiodiplodia theobromae TaxID=45133 RepID=A0A5N5CZM2_9PEZI|nr:Histone-lysine N-methyltransferase EHMT1 [Lasiodiplodia theobromae]
MTWQTPALRELLDAVMPRLGCPVLCFIDALDECEVAQEVEAFCRRLAQIGAKKGTIFRACFSSRHNTKPSTQQQRTLILEEQEGHKRDILTYIEHNLPIGQSESARRICKNLQQKASGVFLWAVVAVKGLRKELAYDRPPMLQRYLDEMPADLPGLYRHILTHGSSDTMLHCLRLVLFSQTPPSPMSLYPLITMLTAGADALSMLSDSLGQRGSIEDRARDFLIDASEGLLEVAGPHASVVQFVHASVSEYLRSDEAISHVWRESPETFEGKGHHVVVGCFRSLIQNVSVPALGTAEHSGYLEYPGWQDDEAGCLERGFGGPVEHYHDEHPGQGFAADELFLPNNHATGAAMQYYHSDAIDASHPSPHTLPPPQHLPPPDDPVSAAVQYAVENILHHSNAAEKAGISQVAFLQSFPLPQYINLKNTLSADQRQSQEPEPYAADTSLLHVLAGENSPALLTTLLATPSHTNEFDRKDPHTGRTPLATAAAHGNVEVVQLLLASAAVDIEARDADGRTPLALAAGGGHTEVVKFLLERAAVDIEAGDDDGRTPLALAAFSGSVEVVRLLLSCQGVRVDARDKLGRTPLSLAAQVGVVEVVDLLFQAGADPGASDAGGRTPLCLAAEEGFPDVCRFLIETGRVDRAAKDVHGASPLDYADWRRGLLKEGESGLVPEFDAVIAMLSKENSQPRLVELYQVEPRQQKPTQQKVLRYEEHYRQPKANQPLHGPGLQHQAPSYHHTPSHHQQPHYQHARSQPAPEHALPFPHEEASHYEPQAQSTADWQYDTASPSVYSPATTCGDHEYDDGDHGDTHVEYHDYDDEGGHEENGHHTYESDGYGHDDGQDSGYGDEEDGHIDDGYDDDDSDDDAHGVRRC